MALVIRNLNMTEEPVDEKYACEDLLNDSDQLLSTEFAKLKQWVLDHFELENRESTNILQNQIWERSEHYNILRVCWGKS